MLTINGDTFSCISFTLKSTTDNTDIYTGIKTFSAGVLIDSKSDIDLLQSYIGATVVFTFDDNEVFNGTLDIVFKQKTTGALIASITATQNYNLENDCIFETDEIVFVSDNKARLPMNLLITTGDYLYSSFLNLRINRVTSYLYVGQAGYTEVGFN